jgi:DNA-binding response OmpR family regulator
MHAHILLIEDDPDLRATLVDALQRAGYQTSTAASIRESKALIAAQMARRVHHGASSGTA